MWLILPCRWHAVKEKKKKRREWTQTQGFWYTCTCFPGGSEGHWKTLEKVSKCSVDITVGCTTDKAVYSNPGAQELGTKRRTCFAANPLHERISYNGRQTAVVVSQHYWEQFLCHILLDFQKLRLNILKGPFCLSGSEKFHQQLTYLVSSSLIYKENSR